MVGPYKEYIQNFLEVYPDDWTIFGLVKHHVESLHLTLDTFRRKQILLDLKRCTFLVPFGNMLGHAFCKQGLVMDLTKISVILNLEARTMLNNYMLLWGTLAATGILS